jgi:virginiamycin A acetyltransferase
MRRWIKAVATLVAGLLVLPVALPVRLAARVDRNDSIFAFGAELLALLPGPPGVYCRRAYYGIVLASGAPGLHIGFCSTLAQRGVHIGRDVYIGAYCSIGLSRIEDDVLIGSQVCVISGPAVHRFDRTDIPIRAQGGHLDAITIGRGSWLANNATVLAAVGEECVVGAGAVVVKPCEPFGVYVGNPARRLHDRRQSDVGPRDGSGGSAKPAACDSDIASA